MHIPSTKNNLFTCYERSLARFIPRCVSMCISLAI